MQTQTNSPEYEAANVAYKAEFAKFDAVRQQYRAGKVSDAVFLAARAAHVAALAAFDVAYAAEAAR